MNKAKNRLLKEFEVISMLVGFITGVGILSLPNLVTTEAKQDGWISVILGGMQPLFLALVSIYYVKKHPNENILILSKKYLGSILGTMCNILFMANFGVYVIFVTTGLSNVFRTYTSPFLTPIKVFIPTVLLVFYLTYKEVSVLVRINKTALYSSVILVFTLVVALQYGKYLNIFPILGSGYKNILRGSMESAYAYGGMEAIFLFYPIIEKKDKIKGIVLKAAFIAIGIYTWITFICIYYLGYKVTSKALWPVLLVTESVNLPVLNSFRLLFLLLWSIIIFKLIANEYYAFMIILTYELKLKDKKKIYYFTFPLIIYICVKVGNEVQRRDLIDKIIPKATLFNIVYVSIIGLMIFVKDTMKGR